MSDTADATILGETKVSHIRWYDHWEVRVMGGLLIAAGSIIIGIAGWGGSKLLVHDRQLTRYETKLDAIEKKIDKLDDKLDRIGGGK